jgi:hypothetical protein
MLVSGTVWQMRLSGPTAKRVHPAARSGSLRWPEKRKDRSTIMRRIPIIIAFGALLIGVQPILWAGKKRIELTHLSSIPAITPGVSAAEIVAYDPCSQRLFVVNAVAAKVDVFDLGNPALPVALGQLDVTAYGGVANSVAVHDGTIAVAAEAVPKTSPGKIVFFDSDLAFVTSVEVGAQPDMITFTPNGRYVLTANEGEPNHYFQPGDQGYDPADPSVDPEGSVSVVDVSDGICNVTQADVRTAGFRGLNGFSRAALFSDAWGNVRVYGPNATVAQDIEPEYIAISHDSRTAWVTLQEANAIAVIDIRTARVSELRGLGVKNHRLAGNGLDSSDQDGGINITTRPVNGLYLPDSIASYRVNGKEYVVMANEGDSRVYTKVIQDPAFPEDPTKTLTVGFNEESTIGSLTLDPVKFPDAATLKTNPVLGRLRISNVHGNTDADAEYERLFTFGARSFSIRKPDGTLVWDSGEEFEKITAAAYPLNFNASNANNALDNRSTSKGPEPEGIALGKAFGRDYAFVGLERIGGVMVYDISDPKDPEFVQYINHRDFSQAANTPAALDLGPEGLAFVSAENSPNGQPLLIVGNEVRGTTTVFGIKKVKK